MRRTPPERAATWAGVAALLLWASLATATAASGALPPFQTLAVSFSIATVLGLAWSRGRGGSPLRTGAPLGFHALAVAGLFGYHAAYFYALRHAPPVEASLIAYLWPLLIVLFTVEAGGAGPRMLLGACLGFGGAAALLVRPGGGFGPLGAGHWAALLCAFVWAGYSTLNRRWSDVPASALAPALGVTAALAWGLHVATEAWVAPGPGQWAALAWLGIGPAGGAFFLWDRGTKRGDLPLLGVLGYLTPVLSTLLLIGVGLDRMRPGVAVGTALIAAGAAVASWRRSGGEEVARAA